MTSLLSEDEGINIWGVSQNYGYLFGGPYNEDYNILGFILGFPYFGKLLSFSFIRILGREQDKKNKKAKSVQEACN